MPRRWRSRRSSARHDWTFAGLLRRTFALDVWACGRCGGKRRVLAYLTAPWRVSAILEHLALPSGPAKRAPAQGPPQLAGC
ncbi:ATP-dependent helicase HrpA [Corallococcus exercitus]|nr:ATP-dependent helicase HrpA [Corallococcus exercitus]